MCVVKRWKRPTTSNAPREIFSALKCRLSYLWAGGIGRARNASGFCLFQWISGSWSLDGVATGNTVETSWSGFSESAIDDRRGTVNVNERVFMEVLGWIGTALVIIAYFPQIRHLWMEKCAWGISLGTWVIWLLSSVLLLIYCILRNEVLLSVVQLSNMASIVLTIVLVRRSNNICPYHLARTETKPNGRKVGRFEPYASARRSVCSGK